MKDRFEKFTSLIMDISRCIQKIKNVEMAKMGLKGKQVKCLFSLFNLKEGASVTHLSEICGEDKAAMSRTISELSEKGLVFVDESDGKKYRNPVRLTEAGNNVAKVVASKVDAMLAQGSADVDEEERKQLYATLAKVLKNLNKICLRLGGEND